MSQDRKNSEYNGRRMNMNGNVIDLIREMEGRKVPYLEPLKSQWK